jgi:hypothetical protein
MKVTELGNSSLINMEYLTHITLPALKTIGNAAFSNTKYIQPNFESNVDLVVHPYAFQWVTVSSIKLPPTYTLYEDAFHNIQTTHTIYTVENQYTADKDKYFSYGAIIKPPTTLTQIDEQMTLLDKQLKKLTNMMVRMTERDRNSMQLLRAIRKGQTMR